MEGWRGGTEKLLQKWKFSSQKQGLLLSRCSSSSSVSSSISISSSILHGAGGGNEKVMRMLLPLLRCWKKKTDDAERINKVKQNKTKKNHSRVEEKHTGRFLCFVRTS